MHSTVEKRELSLELLQLSEMGTIFEANIAVAHPNATNAAFIATERKVNTTWEENKFR